MALRKIWLKRLALAAGALALLGVAALQAVLFAARRAGVQAVELPQGSRIEALAVGADYVDAYVAPLECHGLSIDRVFPRIEEREAARTFNEIVYRGTAPGLYYYASYLLDPPDAPDRFILSTAVFYESSLGAVYFTPVKQVHRRAVPFAVSRQAESWCAGSR